MSTVDVKGMENDPISSVSATSKNLEPKLAVKDVAMLLVPDDEDLGYEEEIIRNPYSLKGWLRYLNFKEGASAPVRNMLYERALREIPGSYKIWFQYLRERKRQVRGRAISDAAWEAVNNTFERCLIFLHKMPRIWLEYLEFLMIQKRITKTRRSFNQALRSLPLSQHKRIWQLYLKFVRSAHVPSLTAIRVFKRYLKVEPEGIDGFVDYLLAAKEWDEAAVQIVRIVNSENFISNIGGKTVKEYWYLLCDIVAQHSETVKSIKVEPIVRAGLKKFSEDSGKLWTTLADYYIRIASFEKARDVFEEGMNTVISLKDFSQIWDAYAKFEDSLIAAQMNDEDADDDEDSMLDFDLRIARYENLVERQPLLVNSVLLRQNPHNVHEWLKRADLYANFEDHAGVVETYSTAIQTVDVNKAKGRPYLLWVKFAEFYERNDDLDSARKIFDKATEAEFKYVEDMASLWCDFAEMELRNGHFQLARQLLERATTPPRGAGSRRGAADSVPISKRAYKSKKLWALYADVEEALGTFQTTKAVYEKIIDLRVATPQVIINFAHLLEEHNYFEESFRAYEKGIALFKFPHVYDLWVAYLTKFVQRYQGKKLERTRELFEQVIESAPPKESKVFYIMYAQLEEEFGLVRHAMRIYDRATKAVEPADRFAMYSLYINRATEFFGVTRTRDIYSAAIDNLPDTQARAMCLRYAELERRLGEVDRARAVLVHGSQFADPRSAADYWLKWREFEVEHGNEDTFREMLRIKRSVQAQYNTQVNYMSAEMLINFKKAETDRIAELERRGAENEMEAAELESLRESQARSAAELDEEDAASRAGLGQIKAADAELQALERLSKKRRPADEEEAGAQADEAEDDEVDMEQLEVPLAVFDNNVSSGDTGALARMRKKRATETTA
eukprot:TRINITY_DN9929_c0_g2_i1.p1 TRINITY_DN9929_c0_g2~~TRINITY_DN9929_c0_g2_i1.p1  ORF type:complete len:904 (-),score=209.68 TRINITY_DN9929_c0_g2_i1:113-2824(-)